MQPFNPDATCPKCGHDEVGSVYVPKRSWGYIDYTEDDQEQKEHIRRRCQRCHYRWNEATLDCGGTDE